MEPITLAVDTIPKGKGRPRITTIGGHPHAYTPKDTIEFEKTIQEAYKAKYDHMSFSDSDYLKAEILIRIPMLKNFTKKQKQQAIDRELLPAKKPDIDNIIKSILDALNNLCYPDDNQIVYVSALKIYSETPGINIFIDKI